jgi:signal peptidase I
MKRRMGPVGCLLALVGIYLLCPFRLGIVCGASMEPTYHNGQAIVVDQGYYRHHPVARGEVILLRQDGRTLIKRVFAVAGDTFHVLVCPDDVGVNRYILAEEDVPRMRRVFRIVTGGQRISRVTVPNGSLYVLGDNTSASIDSRDFGTVPLTDVIARVNDQRPGSLVTQGMVKPAPSRIRRPTPARLAQTAAAATVRQATETP